MSLSPAIKALIHAPHARGSSLAAPASAVFAKTVRDLARRGESKGRIDHRTWLTLSTGTLVTVNSPDSLCALYDIASKDVASSGGAAEVASIIREAALKCISFSGIPRTINALSSLRHHIPVDILAKLTAQPVRELHPDNILETQQRGRRLWDDIYQPHSLKLLQRLGESHPDLPVHILTGHYSQLLSDPVVAPGGFSLGRTLTSVLAIACLRAQTGVAPQVTSHIHGLMKASEAGLAGQEWLQGEEGVIWVLESVDALADLIRSSQERS